MRNYKCTYFEEIQKERLKRRIKNAFYCSAMLFGTFLLIQFSL